MYKRIFLISLFLVLMPIVYGEEVFFTTHINISVSEGDLLIKTNSLTSQGKEYKLENITNSTSIDEQFDFVLKEDLTCTANSLSNLTEIIVDTCNQVAKFNEDVIDIYNANTDCSLRLQNLSTEIRLSRTEAQKCETNENSLDCSNFGYGQISCTAYQQVQQNSERGWDENSLWAYAALGMGSWLLYTNRNKFAKTQEDRG